MTFSPTTLKTLFFQPSDTAFTPEQQAAFEKARLDNPHLTTAEFLERSPDGHLHQVVSGTAPQSLVTALRVPNTFKERYQAVKKAIAEGSLEQQIPLVDAFVKDVMHIIDQEVGRAGGFRQASIPDAITFLQGEKLTLLPHSTGSQTVYIDLETTIRARIITEAEGIGPHFSTHLEQSSQLFSHVAKTYLAAKRPVTIPQPMWLQTLDHPEFPRRKELVSPEKPPASSILKKIFRRILRR